MNLQNKVYALRAGIIEEDWNELISESFEYDEDSIDQLLMVYEEIQQIVEALPKAAYVSAMRRAHDYDSENSADPDKIVARAKKHHGSKFASDLAGMDKKRDSRLMNKFPTDKLATRKPTAVTKSGKANKQAIQKLKSTIKWDKKIG